MMDIPVRRMFFKIIEWYIGIDTGFSVSTGKSGRFIDKYLPAEDYDKILNTYPDHQIENIKASLFLMTEIFHTYAKKIVVILNFRYSVKEQENTLKYLKKNLSDKKKKPKCRPEDL